MSCHCGGRHFGWNLTVEAWNECFSSCVCVFLFVAPVHTCEIQTQSKYKRKEMKNFPFLAFAFALL